MDTKKNHWVMDYETICNCFVAVFIQYKDDSIKRTFVINETTNDFERFYSFLSGNLKDNLCTNIHKETVRIFISDLLEGYLPLFINFFPILIRPPHFQSLLQLIPRMALD